jgi:signal transduction histidine kinase
VSVRARFALACGALVLLVAAAVAAAGYYTLRGSLLDQARRSVGEQAASVVRVVSGGGSADEGNFVDLTDPAILRQFVRPGLWLVVLGPSSRIIQRTPGAPRSLATAALVARCRSSGSATSIGDVVAACRRVGSGRGFIVAARPLTGEQRTLSNARRAFLLGVLGGVAAAFALAWLIAGRALRPLRLIAATARSIRRGDLSRRIGYRRRDELGGLAAELDASFEELEAGVRRQERFVADASHELKTPVAATQANVQLLRRWAAEDPARREEALAAIERSTARMSRIVADLVQLAHGDDRLRYANEPVALDDVLLEAAREARVLSEEGRVSIEELEQVGVRGDRDRLAQLVSNLVDNGLRAGGSVRLGLGTSAGESRLWVADDGPGIPAAELPRIFDRFYRGAGGGPESGSGLGLAIASAIAKAHGGRIDVETREGEGSRFTLVLPVVRSSSDRHVALSGGSSKRSTVTDEKGGRSIETLEAPHCLAGRPGFRGRRRRGDREVAVAGPSPSSRGEPRGEGHEGEDREAGRDPHVGR